MATIAVDLVLQTLVSLISEEAQLLGGLPEGIEDLRDNLASMKSFLQDAETRNDTTTDHGLKTWICQVRDVAYDTEDVLDEFLIRFSSPPSHRGIARVLLNSYHHILRLKSRHKLANQIQNIKLRVKSISDIKNAFSLNSIESSSNHNFELVRYDPRIASLYIDEADVVGIEEPKSVLTRWLVEGEDKLTAICVVGMGGLGKTTLAKKAFDSPSVKLCFDCQAWVTVSKSFTRLELLQTMLKSFLEAAKDPRQIEVDRMTELNLVDAIQKHLLGKSYLIAFDDVWSIDSWEAVKYALPKCNRQSRIIFTTRSNELVDSIETTCRVYHLKPLHETEAWMLFCMKVFRGEEQGVCPERLEKMSYNILKKCEGLPLAIVLIGGLLSKKNKNLMEWKKINDTLGAEMRSENKLESLGRIIMLSYDDLPYHLKSCFLYLSVFPEDYLIKRMKIIRLWVVERFVEHKQGMTMEEVAEHYLNELVSRSMIQVVRRDYFGRVLTCRLHDLTRELVQMKSKDQSLVMIVDDETISINEKVRRLSIHDDSCEKLPCIGDMKLPYLRSLLVFTSTGSSSLTNISFNGFRYLRVLELENTSLTKFPQELTKLIHLRYLSLRRTLITELPNSIKKLQNLEILDLKGCDLSLLPDGILKLKHLHQFRNYHYRHMSSNFFPDTYGSIVPIGIGSLTSLEKLVNVELNSSNSVEILQELGNLTRLRRLGILKLRGEDGIEVSSCLQKLSQLTGLYMTSMAKNEVIDLNSVTSPPQYLQRLYLKFSLPYLPRWIESLQYLGKLVLESSNLEEEEDPFRSLQGLPSLVVLEIRQDAYKGEELQCGGDGRGFPMLKKLSVMFLSRLKCITVEEGAMPQLEMLEIMSCMKLETVPRGIEHLKSLRELGLWYMPYNLLKKIEQPHGEDYWRVKHIPNIREKQYMHILFHNLYMGELHFGTS